MYLDAYQDRIPKITSYMLSRHAADIDIDCLYIDAEESTGFSNKKYENFFNRYKDLTFNQLLKKCKFTERELQILKLLYFNNFTHDEVGKKLNLTRARISQINKDILDNFRKVIKNN